jgi:hypothetical protein
MARLAKRVYPLHPYTAYENTPLWKAIDRAISDLVSNQDMVEDEYHDYIVGYICKVVNRRRSSIVRQFKTAH